MRISHKHSLITFFFALLGTLLLLSACGDEAVPTPTSAPPPTPTPLVNRNIGYATGPVARVNGEEIPAMEFNQALDQVRVTAEEEGGGFIDWNTADNKTRLKELQEQALEGLINYYVIAQEAKKEGVNVTQDELNQQVEDFKKQLGGDAAYKTWLAKRFLTDEDNHRVVQQGLLFQKMQDRHSPVDDKAEQVKARHILLATEQEAKDMYTRLQQGADFAALARQFSLDAASAKNGGDLDWVFPGQTDPAFEKVLFALKPGEFSGPVKTSLGWHIIQSLAKEVRPLPFDLVQQHKEEAFSNYVKSLRDNSKIETLFKP